MPFCEVNTGTCDESNSFYGKVQNLSVCSVTTILRAYKTHWLFKDSQKTFINNESKTLQ